MKLSILALATFVAAMAISTDAMKIKGSAINPKGCGDDCNSDADCDSSCPNCFLGACFYFSKADNATRGEDCDGYECGDEEDCCYDNDNGTYFCAPSCSIKGIHFYICASNLVIDHIKCTYLL